MTGTIRSEMAVARLVKGAAKRAKLDSRRYSGHSLRAGLATAAGGSVRARANGYFVRSGSLPNIVNDNRRTEQAG